MQITCPHDNTDTHTSKDISHGYRQQINQKEIAPRKHCRVSPGLRGKHRVPGNLHGKNSCRNVVHIRNAVFEAADDEESYRYVCSGDAPYRVLRGQAAEHAVHTRILQKKPNTKAFPKGIAHLAAAILIVYTARPPEE